MGRCATWFGARRAISRMMMWWTPRCVYFLWYERLISVGNRYHVPSSEWFWRDLFSSTGFVGSHTLDFVAAACMLADCFGTLHGR